jgi:hypothetical protein
MIKKRSSKPNYGVVCAVCGSGKLTKEKGKFECRSCKKYVLVFNQKDLKTAR